MKRKINFCSRRRRRGGKTVVDVVVVVGARRLIKAKEEVGEEILFKRIKRHRECCNINSFLANVCARLELELEPFSEIFRVFVFRLLFFCARRAMRWSWWRRYSVDGLREIYYHYYQKECSTASIKRKIYGADFRSLSLVRRPDVDARTKDKTSEEICSRRKQECRSVCGSPRTFGSLINSRKLTRRGEISAEKLRSEI